ncbi:MAG TPA: sulfurtransferase-like selenium metabolism protein YedF [Desulfosporosinus sp.]|nr:sulfurtransferase-like selenium metabolism protein YedF [Desulfosporosinus sp.]
MSKFVYFISSDKIGNQDPKLGHVLMRNFFRKLIEASEKPTHLLFVESGVKLLLPEFEAIEAFKQLEEEGVKLLLCKTCLDFYDIGEKIVAGEESNMPSIIQAMHEADKVISL